MATFVYSPAIRVHVDSTKYGILDISEDITQWEVVRRSNAPSSFTFKLQNTQRKYDGAFTPQDRITVELKRIVWVRVFTGSLNTVPIFSAWPRELTMSATCTLKKLQFWPWDPTDTASFNMINNFMTQATGPANQDTTSGDANLYKLITEALVRVTDWDPKAIHLGAVPNDWFKWAQKTEQEVAAADSMAAVLGPATIGGTTVTGSIKIKSGHYGTSTLSQAQVDNAAQIFAVAAGPVFGLTDPALQDRAATLALMTALAESSLINLGGGDRDSVGLFQQRASWGTTAQREDVTHATLSFLRGTSATGADGTTQGGHISGLIDHSNWKTSNNLAMVCQEVQGSAFSDGSNYAQMQSTAEALVTACRSAATSAISAVATGAQEGLTSGSGLTPTGKSAKGTGYQMAATAYNLIKSNPPGTIHYSQERGTAASDPRSDKPTRLDCSSLVDWVYYHVTGTVWSASNADGEYHACPVRDIPMEYAKYIQGCLLYGVGESDGSFGDHPGHTGISMGDGTMHVAAHDVTPGHLQDANVSPLPGGLYSGGLAPGIDYSAAATTEAARAYLEKVTSQKTSIAKGNVTSGQGLPSNSGTAPGSNSQTDPFQQLISAVTTNPNTSGADLFGGKRELMNNQPFLPWIGNLTNSTMRAYCSAPNGDFIAWFPDYFNVWKTAAIMDIKLIELKDFTVEWSDQQMVTHEFVVGAISPGLDTASGSIIETGTYDKALLSTEGLATMDYPQIFRTIYGKPATSKFVTDYVERYGARPNVEAMPNIIHGPQEFYMALWMFMKHWAEQFNAVVPMTFMPELWPGMIIRIQEYGFQAYVSQVVHRGTYGQNGGFTTDAQIIAPAPIDENTRGSLFGMLDPFETGKGKAN